MNPSDQIIRLYTVRVAEPDLHDPSSDARRLALALADQHGVFGIEIGLGVLRTLQKTLRQGAWTVTAALRGATLVALYPGQAPHLFGVAFDAGATMLEASLHDMATGESMAFASAVNPHIRFGADVMTRIAYSMNHADGAQAMTQGLREALNALIGQLCEQASISRAMIVEIAFCANPVTHHLMLGLDPVELGGAPFALATDQAVDVLASELHLDVAPGAFVHVLAPIGGHVGSDLAAAGLSIGLAQSEAATLLIDIGTTTEIMLGSRGKVFASAPPAGGALEGLQIEAGQHAAPGAIAEFRIDPVTWEPRFKVIGCELWSDAAGFADATEALTIKGLCRSGLIDAMAELRLVGLMGRDGTLDPDGATRTSRIREEYRSQTYLIRENDPRIAITQHDIRALQMAKAAVQASARILLKRHGGGAIDRVVISGNSGCRINPLHAAIMGLFPDCLLDHVTVVDNAALAGTVMALLSASARNEVADLARRAIKVETVLDPDFQSAHIDAMGLPNRALAYPLLGQSVTLADNDAAIPGRRGERRKR